jgi:hypothetical protein
MKQRLMFKRFFGMITRNAYQKLVNNSVPQSEAHFLINENLVLMVGLPYDKSNWRKLIKKGVKSEKPVGYAVVTPIWLAPATKGVPQDLLPSNHPFRRDSIIITAYSPFQRKCAFIDYEWLTPKIIEVQKPLVWKWGFTDGLVGNVYRGEQK